MARISPLNACCKRQNDVEPSGIRAKATWNTAQRQRPQKHSLRIRPKATYGLYVPVRLHEAFIRASDAFKSHQSKDGRTTEVKTRTAQEGNRTGLERHGTTKGKRANAKERTAKPANLHKQNGRAEGRNRWTGQATASRGFIELVGVLRRAIRTERAGNVGRQKRLYMRT
jgi:hypothetical protein